MKSPETPTIWDGKLNVGPVAASTLADHAGKTMSWTCLGPGEHVVNSRVSSQSVAERPVFLRDLDQVDEHILRPQPGIVPKLFGDRGE